LFIQVVNITGDVYEGGFKENKYHGYGKIVYSKVLGEHKGEIYEGEWRENIRHGN
jgi:hypothetical protein